MKRYQIAEWIFAAALVTGTAGIAAAQNAPAPAAKPATPAPAPAPAPTPAPAPSAAPTAGAAATTDVVGPAAPGQGVVTSRKAGANLHVVVAGHTFTSRGQIETYLAYQVAEQTLQGKFDWFQFKQQRTKGDTVPAPKPDPMGMRYSFRMAYFQPVWRYKISGSPAWKTWSPFSNQPFFADGIDAKTITDFEVTADATMKKGMVQDDFALAFDASALDDYLINQVQPPK